MLDLKFIRENPEAVRKAIAMRNDSAPIDEILELDEQRRSNLATLEELRRERKLSSKANDEPSREKGRQIRDKIKNLEDIVREIELNLNDMLLRVPNIPQSSVPEGKSEDDNIVIRTIGTPRKFDFSPLPHWDIGEDLGIIDFEAGTKISGSRFYVLKGEAATLQRALIDFMLDTHIREHNYRTYVPVMVRKNRSALPIYRNLPIILP